MSMVEISESTPSMRTNSLEEKSTQQLFYLLNMNLLYDASSSNGLGSVVSESEMFANKIIQKILSDGATLLYDNYLNAKLTDHSLSHNTYLLELIMKQELLFYDDRSLAENEKIHEDSEPLPSHHENWKALSVQIEKQEHIVTENSDQPIRRDSDQISISQHSRKSIYQDKPRKSDGFLAGSMGSSANRGSMSKSLFEGDKTLKLVDLSVPREIVREEEQLRVLKERENLIKQEKMQLEAIRNQELKEQQARLRGMQDVNKKMFTYDFDGKYIMTNPVKTEKLPPFNYAVNSQVTKVDAKPTAVGTSAQAGNIVAQKEVTQPGSGSGVNSSLNSTQQQQQQTQPDVVEEKRNSKRLLQPLGLQGAAPASNNLGQDRTGGQFYGGVGDGKEMFDQFKMASGVTLIDPMKQKKGPNFGANLDTSALNSSILNTTLSQNGNNIRMTRDEYNAVIKSGNLIKSQLQPSLQQQQHQNTKLTSTFDESLHNDSINAHFLPNGQSFLLNNNDSRIKNNQSLNYSRLKKISTSQHDHSAIKISDRSRFIEAMSSIDQINEQQLKELEVIRAKQEKFQTERKAASAQQLMKNPNDEFNMLIFQNKHISDKKNAGYILPPLITPRPNEYLRAKQAIGFLTQNPRDRAPKHVMNASAFHTRLPPPGLGRTLGHGLDQGFNPDKLESLEGILERIQNTSIHNASQNQK